MSAITVRGVTLLPPCQVTAGQFRVIVPVMAGDLAPLPAAARTGDLVELRLDALAPLEEETLSTILLKTRDQIGPGKPLLATIRTAREGGLASLTAEQYAALCRAVCRTGAADLLDVELSAGEQTACALRDAAHAAGMAVVFSSHDFDKTPDAGAMTRRLCRMGELGADIAKLAVMPHTAADAAALLQATAGAAAAMPHTPLITMSMGPLGAVTRVCGAAFGSCAGFATAGVSSAPGQPDAAALRAALAALHQMNL